MLDFNQCLNTAKSAALLAGKFLANAKGKNLEVLSNTDRDIKLQIDIDTEKLIKKHISSDSSYPILGEETGSSGNLDGLYWIVDPIDGTSNFLRGIPISCVSIALMQDMKPILGVIYDFNHDEIYWGHKESKAYIDDKEISVLLLAKLKLIKKMEFFFGTLQLALLL